MNCPICNTPLEAGTKVCPHCNTKLKVLDASIRPKAPKRHLKLWRKMWIPCITAAVLAAGIWAGVLLIGNGDPSLQTPPDPANSSGPRITTDYMPIVPPSPPEGYNLPDYLLTKASIQFNPYDNQSILYNTEVIPVPEGTYTDSRYSRSTLDGRIFAYLTDDDQLMLVRNREVTLISKNVLSFSMSLLDGKIAYVVPGIEGTYDLIFYDPAAGYSYPIQTGFASIEQMALSPSGNLILFLAGKDDGIVYLYQAEQLLVTPEDVMPASLSYHFTVQEKGQFNSNILCVSDYGTAFFYNGTTLSRMEYGKMPISVMHSSWISSVTLNYDHTELLVTLTEGTTEIYRADGSIGVFSSQGVNFILPDQARSILYASPLSSLPYVTTLPISSFIYAPYTLKVAPWSSVLPDPDIYFRDKDLWGYKVSLENVRNFRMSESGKDLYILNTDGLYQLSMKNLYSTPKLLTECSFQDILIGPYDAQIFLSNGDDVQVYFTQTGDLKPLAFRWSYVSIALDRDDRFYYLLGNELRFAQLDAQRLYNITELSSNISELRVLNGVVIAIEIDGPAYVLDGPHMTQLNF